MLKVAVAGLGWWGKIMLQRLKDSPHVRIVQAIDPNPAQEAVAKAAGVPFTTDFAAAIKDPGLDGVILCTPHSLHTEQVLAIAAARKHVFCEKPLALTRENAERSVAACKAAGVTLGIGHERRYEPANEEVRRLIEAGTLGTIMHAEANFNHDKLANVPKGDWRANPKDAPAAGMTAMGIHLTDLYQELLGPISEVFAMTAKRVAYDETGDVVSALMRFQSGATGYINAVLVTPHYLTLTVFGSQAWVEVVNHTHPDTPGDVTLTLQHRDGRRETKEFKWTDTVRANVELWARAAKGEATYRFTDVQKIGNIATLEAICRSVAENRPVAIAPVS